jgi:hypothetical protein
LRRQKEFLVSKVDANSISIFVNKNKYTIQKDLFLDLWEELRKTGVLKRSSVERRAVKCTSQLVALLSQLPGVQVQLRPIQLHFLNSGPANFLIRK